MGLPRGWTPGASQEERGLGGRVQILDFEMVLLRNTVYSFIRRLSSNTRQQPRRHTWDLKSRRLGGLPAHAPCMRRVPLWAHPLGLPSSASLFYFIAKCQRQRDTDVQVTRRRGPSTEVPCPQPGPQAFSPTVTPRPAPREASLSSSLLSMMQNSEMGALGSGLVFPGRRVGR